MTDSLFDTHTKGDYTCPWCGERNDRAEPLGHEKELPTPGAVLLCIRCAKPSIHQEHGKPRRPTESEWAVLNADENITLQRKAIFMANHGNVNYRNMDVLARDEGDE